ncbi:hypothetical protein RvVAT039_pl12130 (plasmid) [Agrobacterium vitis]|uniref:hypothetical protein n=1 Tax=Agrobacterium vitis TaxID=373 RepID=UPI0015D8ACD5|nr:hypothetical protein [Agrobacterium vitis]BCH62643.1 hypothetical protein RvVAR0630_pl07850 [Agrobacterium vitis]BCH68380.1 hypothetical protein RvVAT039_pl12130 [Agrobacterium vitis]
MTPASSSSAEADGKVYSKAFENMVNGPDDVVGLLAYALYKQTIAEDALQGQHPTSAQRNPGVVAVALYRSSAEQKLSAFASSVLEDAREGIQQSAIIDKLQEVEGRVKSHVSSKTSFGMALFTNVIGWLLTLAITVLVILVAAASGVGDSFLSRFEKAMQPKQIEQTAQPQN